MQIDPVDGVDLLIIRALEADPRAPLSVLARAAGVSDSTASRRLERLRTRGLVELYALRQPFPPGSTQAVIGLSVDPPRRALIAEALAQDPRIRYVAVCTGEFDVVLEGSFTDLNDLARFLEASGGRASGVKSMRTFVVMTMVKFLSRVASDTGDGAGDARSANGTASSNRIGVY